MTDATADPPRPAILAAARGVSIAYHRTPGKPPGVVFLTGFMSDMAGSKALALEELCRRRGHLFVRFDYAGHGRSSGRFEEQTITTWTEDALAVVDALTEGPLVLVGSSMGGWIALNVALRRPARVRALVGVAAAPDFTQDLMWDAFPPATRAQLEREGLVRLPSLYGPEPYPISLALIRDGERHRRLHAPIPFGGPVRLLHGMRDPDVPWQRSLTLAEKLVTADVRVALVKDGDHRLSRPQDLDLLTRTVDELLSAPA